MVHAESHQPMNGRRSSPTCITSASQVGLVSIKITSRYRKRQRRESWWVAIACLGDQICAFLSHNDLLASFTSALCAHSDTASNNGPPTKTHQTVHRPVCHDLGFWSLPSQPCPSCSPTQQSDCCRYTRPRRKLARVHTST